MVERIILHSKTQISLSERFQKLDEERKIGSPLFNRRGGRRGGSGGLLPRVAVDSLMGPSRGRIDKRRGPSGVGANWNRNNVVREPTDPQSNVRTVSVGSSGYDISPPGWGRGRGRGRGSRRGFGVPLRGGLVFSPRPMSRGRGGPKFGAQPLLNASGSEREVMTDGPVMRLFDTDELHQAGYFRGRGRGRGRTPRGRGPARGFRRF